VVVQVYSAVAIPLSGGRLYADKADQSNSTRANHDLHWTRIGE